MGLNLTKPALAYDDQPPVDDQSPIIDPATGLPIKVKPRVSFFPNNASRDWQFAHDAAQAAQPATANVSGKVEPEPSGRGVTDSVSAHRSTPATSKVSEQFQPEPLGVTGRDWQAPVPGGIGPEQPPPAVDIGPGGLPTNIAPDPAELKRLGVPENFAFDKNYGSSPDFDQQTSFSKPPAGVLPKFLRPTVQQVANMPDPTTGQPQDPMTNPGFTKFAKLLGLVKTLASGAAGGYGEPNFGAGFKEGTFRPYEEAGAQQQVEKGRLENQQAQVNLAFTPLRYSQMGAELQNKRADTAWKNAHAAYLNGISEVKDIPTLQQEYSRASMEAIAQNMKPMDSPKVRAIAGAITNLQKNQRDPVAQRKAFADSNQEMFGDADERKNFVLYGHDPEAKQSNATEWSLRVAASKGDPDAKRALRSYLADQKSLSDERADARATAQKTKGQDAANAEQIAGQILDSAGGDPDKALKFFDQQSGKITDPDQQRLGPSIRKAIRARKQINKPVSPIDRIINGDIEGGLGDMQQPQP